VIIDPNPFVKHRIRENRPALAWNTHSAETEEWQMALRSRLDQVLGNLSAWERVPLNPRISEVVEQDGYRREAVTFATRPGLDAFGYFLMPLANAANDYAGRRPTVLCLPGHGRGVASIIGVAEDGGQRLVGEPEEYANDFALQCLAQGWSVFALEQISFGVRRGVTDSMDAGASSCVPDSMAALMLGETMIGWRVWDAMRSLDYLTTRPEVDPNRLMLMGISGGGSTGLFTAALDTRIWGAMISGYLNTFADSVLAIRHCVDNYAPGLVTIAEMSDIAGCIAPRRLFAENGSEDPIFPVEAFRRATAKVSEIYTAFGASENFAYEIFEGGHLFHGEQAFPFLKEHLASEG
jgi:hypothetical protein